MANKQDASGTSIVTEENSDKEQKLAAAPVSATATPGNAADYDAGTIDVLEGLEAVRKRPGMYIGSTGPRGLHHLVWEIVDNSVDEALAGYCKNIDITINEDNSVTVQDDGRGIPTGIVEKSGKSGVETVFTILHAGGKFGGAGYKVSGGLHGVGASVVNALSERLEAEIHRDGKAYKQAYNRGEPDGGLVVVGPSDKRGTKVTFWPDDVIFHDVNEDNERVKIVVQWDVVITRLREMAFLNKGLKITVTDKREPDLSQTFHYEGGIASYVEYINDTRDVIHKPPIYFEMERDNIVVECALQWTEQFTESIYTFVNNIKTGDGGTHLTGFRNALTRIINEYSRKTPSVGIKESDANLTGEDVREGLTAIISVKVPEPQFEGQTKERLGNREVQGVTQSVVSERLSDWLELNPNPAKKIVQKALQARLAREAAQNAKRRLDVNLLWKILHCQENYPTVQIGIQVDVKSILLKVTPPVVAPKLDVIETFKRYCLCEAKFSTLKEYSQGVSTRTPKFRR